MLLKSLLQDSSEDCLKHSGLLYFGSNFNLEQIRTKISDCELGIRHDGCLKKCIFYSMKCIERLSRYWDGVRKTVWHYIMRSRTIAEDLRRIWHLTCLQWRLFVCFCLNRAKGYLDISKTPFPTSSSLLLI
jgi:hypothetical protein